jgi:hypothetical protein
MRASLRNTLRNPSQNPAIGRLNMTLFVVLEVACVVLLVAIILQHIVWRAKFLRVNSIFSASTKLQALYDQLGVVELSLAGARHQISALDAAALTKRGEISELESMCEKIRQAEKDLVHQHGRAAAQKSEAELELNAANGLLSSLHRKAEALAVQYKEKQDELRQIEERCHHVVSMESKANCLRQELEAQARKVASVQLDSTLRIQESMAELARVSSELQEERAKLDLLMGKIDLYSRIDEYIKLGHYEVPDYLYHTTGRYELEIKIARDRQREMIRLNKAITYPGNLDLPKRLMDGQVSLMLSAFNLECDLLIDKVSPGSFDRTLEQIEKRAEQLERCASSLHCGFSNEYVQEKYIECKLQYEYRIKRREEQEEQRLVREQMKEEARLLKQYKETMLEAEAQEATFRRLLAAAMRELAAETAEQRTHTLARIAILEAQLQEAIAKGQRAKSMAEQTRRGFVYVISNTGAFGEGVYKIGLTRRLDPQERVDELGSASVPFPFDVHAMFYSEDAPSLETALHRRFSHRRINAVNLRKEFFRVSLAEIRG